MNNATLNPFLFPVRHHSHDSICLLNRIDPLSPTDPSFCSPLLHKHYILEYKPHCIADHSTPSCPSFRHSRHQQPPPPFHRAKCHDPCTYNLCTRKFNYAKTLSSLKLRFIASVVGFRQMYEVFRTYYPKMVCVRSSPHNKRGCFRAEITGLLMKHRSRPCPHHFQFPEPINTIKTKSLQQNISGSGPCRFRTGARCLFGSKEDCIQMK